MQEIQADWLLGLQSVTKIAILNLEKEKSYDLIIAVD